MGNNNNNSSKSDGKQFVQAESHLLNHVKELDEKILSVVDAILSQQLASWSYSGSSSSGKSGTSGHQIPSACFKTVSKQLTKLHESVADIWPESDMTLLMVSVQMMVSPSWPRCVTRSPRGSFPGKAASPVTRWPFWERPGPSSQN